MKLSPDVLFSLAFAMFLCGILGARLFYVIEYWETRFSSDDWPQTFFKILKFTEGGLVVYGAFLGATLAFLLFTLRRRLPPLAVADLIAPSLLAGLALGRIGCLLNGCCYGGETMLPWAVSFPRGSMSYTEQLVGGQLLGLHYELPSGSFDTELPTIDGIERGSLAERAGLTAGMKIDGINKFAVNNFGNMYGILSKVKVDHTELKFHTTTGESFIVALPAGSLPVHPTQIYSAVQAALLSWVLWSFYPYRSRDGEVIALMLVVYPISRFLLEMIRIDESAVFGTGLSISQNISIVLFVLALGLWGYLRSQTPQRADFAALMSK